jgi:hypothetical protein
VVVDAPSSAAARFYEAHAFIPMPESRRLVLPLQTLARQFVTGPGLTKSG